MASVNTNLYCKKSVFQSGFGWNFSKKKAITYSGDTIFDATKGKLTGIVLLDSQKAFGIVDHKILLSKVKVVGAKNLVLKWFIFLSWNRKQFADIQATLSLETSVSCGVQQGSISGSLLFKLYINDMLSDIKCDICLHAYVGLTWSNGSARLRVEGRGIDAALG